MKTAKELTEKVLTEIKELSTQDRNISMALSVPQSLPDFGFKTFGDPVLEQMFKSAGRFCMEIKSQPLKPRWLSFLGSSETGKTFLARAIYNWVKQNCRAPVAGLDTGTCVVDVPGRNKFKWEQWAAPIGFVDWRKLCGRLREGGWDELNWIGDAWFIVLDDIGTEYDPNGLMASALDRIFNNRLRKWFITTSNKSLKEISSEMDVRIASRMQRDNGEVIEIILPPYSSRVEAVYVI